MADSPTAEFAPAEERPYTTLNEWLEFSEANDCTQLEADPAGGHGIVSSPCGSSWSALVTSDCQPSALCIQQLDKMKLFAEGTVRRKVVMGLLEAAMICCQRFRDYQLSGFLETKDIECKMTSDYFDKDWQTVASYWQEEWQKIAPFQEISGAEKEAIRNAERVAAKTGGSLWFPFGAAPSPEGMAWITKIRRWFFMMSAAQLNVVIANHGGMTAPDPAWWTPRIRALQGLPTIWMDRWALCDPDKLQTIQSVMVVLQANMVAELLEAGIAPSVSAAQVPNLVDWKQVETYRAEFEEATASAVASNYQWFAGSADRDREQAEQWLAENCKIGAYNRAISKSFGRFLAICHPDGRTEIQQATIGKDGALPELVTVDEGQVVVEDVAPASPAGGLPAALLWGGAGLLAAGPTGAAIGAAAGLFYDAQKGKL